MIARLMGEIKPQPPRGIKYMLGSESWLHPEKQTPRLLHCEEWGNLGPMELNTKIKDNGHGFRVRHTRILAPEGAMGYCEHEGKLHWCSKNLYGEPFSGAIEEE